MQTNVLQSGLSNVSSFIVQLSNLPLSNATRVEKLGGFLLMSLGSFLSPVWPMLDALMKPLMNIIFSASNPFKGYIMLIHHLRDMGAHDVFYELQLPMLGLAIIQFAFVFLCFKLGSKLTRQALESPTAEMA